MRHPSASDRRAVKKGIECRSLVPFPSKLGFARLGGGNCLRAIAAVLACSALAAALAGTLASCSSQSSTDDALARLDAIAEDFLGKTKPRPRVPEWAGKS
jgi:hypothetical protein